MTTTRPLAALCALAALGALPLAGCLGDTPTLPPVVCIPCGDACVDVRTDVANCGACGTACAAGQVCQASKCVLAACPAGLVLCSGRCIDPLSNATYCGASAGCSGATAGTACGTGQGCFAGTCKVGCAADRVLCEATCVDPAADPDFCGASDDCAGDNAGSACPAGQYCASGTCACAGGGVVCGGECVDPATSQDHCGARGSCTGSSAGTACADTEICVDGECRLPCGEGRVVCDGRCIDPLYDDLACGIGAGCTGGQVCRGADRCIEGACKPAYASCEELAAGTIVSSTCYMGSTTGNPTDKAMSEQACSAFCSGYEVSLLTTGPALSSCPYFMVNYISSFSPCILSSYEWGLNGGDSCTENLVCRCGQDDGPKTLYFQGRPDQPFTAYCRDLFTAPKTYLTLPAGEISNYAQFTAGGGKTGTSVRTAYSRVRLDPLTGLVDIGDRTYSSTTGALDAVASMPFGTAAGCEAGVASGLAGVDLRGTHFRVASDWTAGGTNPVGAATGSSNNQLFSVTGGGECGWLNPGDAALADPAAQGELWNLKLTYSPWTSPLP